MSGTDPSCAFGVAQFGVLLVRVARLELVAACAAGARASRPTTASAARRAMERCKGIPPSERQDAVGHASAPCRATPSAHAPYPRFAFLRSVGDRSPCAPDAGRLR